MSSCHSRDEKLEDIWLSLPHWGGDATATWHKASPKNFDNENFLVFFLKANVSVSIHAVVRLHKSRLKYKWIKTDDLALSKKYFFCIWFVNLTVESPVLSGHLSESRLPWPWIVCHRTSLLSVSAVFLSSSDVPGGWQSCFDCTIEKNK